MTRQVIIGRDAEPGQRFAPDAFARQLGQDVPVHLPDGSTHTGRLIAAEVVEDGSRVEFTLEVSEALGLALAEVDAEGRLRAVSVPGLTAPNGLSRNTSKPQPKGGAVSQ